MDVVNFVYLDTTTANLKEGQISLMAARSRLSQSFKGGQIDRGPPARELWRPGDGFDVKASLSFEVGLPHAGTGHLGFGLPGTLGGRDPAGGGRPHSCERLGDQPSDHQLAV